MQPSTRELKKLSLEFLDWMKSSQSWQTLHQDWKGSASGPWSLPFALNRHYLRFLFDLHPESRNRERSLTGERLLLDASDLENPGINTRLISNPILDAFASLTQRLEPELRLVYQLHLEGLLNDEIAAVLQLTEINVEKIISQAKGSLGLAINSGEKIS